MSRTDIETDVWFHRYKDGIDIEGRFDYNSWQESEKGLKLAASLPKDVVLAEGTIDCTPYHVTVTLTLAAGYSQYDTGRKPMARMGDWRDNKDIEIPLDGIGGVNILVKADVHRSGRSKASRRSMISRRLITVQASTSRATPLRTKPRQKASPRWLNVRVMACMVYRITLSGTSIRRRSLVMHNGNDRRWRSRRGERGDE